MTGPSTRSTGRRVHRLVEHYTPQGALGRVLLGVVALGLSPALVVGGMAGVGGVFSLLPFVAGLLSLVAGVAAAVVGVLTLWPVYLSLIGNVESPAEYPVGSSLARRAAATGSASDGTGTPAVGDGDLDAEELLKRRYAAGDLSREEFERRLDAILDGEERRRVADRGRRREREVE